MTTIFTNYNLPPSLRRRPKWGLCPVGMIDVWRVSYRSAKDKWTLSGYFKKEVSAWSLADQLWEQGHGTGLRVEHKAGISVNGKLYLVNILPIQCKDDDLTTESNNQDKQANYTRNTTDYSYPW